MLPHIALTTFLVRDYDRAADFFTRALDFEIAEDADMGDGKRWLVVRPRGAAHGLLLARAATPEQEAAVGRQGGGRVFQFLHTDDFARDHARMSAAGVVFREAPRSEPYGTVAVFEDLYGQPWDLIEPRGYKEN
jgi:catechol 2,3-dioxygenase-like lactoylglutathione lyase family enzyme